MNRNLIELRLCITCALCNQNRVRVVHLAPSSSVMADNQIYYVNADNYRVCSDCERRHSNDAATIRANIESRRQNTPPSLASPFADPINDTMSAIAREMLTPPDRSS